MKVIIIDDEPLARKQVRNSLETHADIEIIGECSNGFEAIKLIQEHKPDLIFLDIQMPRITGFELLELLENPPIVIFTTAYDEFALKAFEANAIDYLLKPFGQERFDQAIEKGRKALLTIENQPKLGLITPESAGRIVLKHQGEIRIILVKDILYLEAWDDYVKIHTEEQVFVKKQTLSYYENCLPPSEFIRCHRRYLANVKAITAIDSANGDTWEIRLINGKYISASKSGYQKLKQILGF